MSNFRKKKHTEEKSLGASSIEKMEEASTPILSVPFNGTEVLCRVRCLNQTQIKAVGEFHLIDIEENKGKNSDELSLSDLISLVNWQEALVKEIMIEPTFDEVIKKVYSTDVRISDLKNRACEIRALIDKTEGKEKKKFEKELNSIELYIGSLFPSDFMNFLTGWATGVDRSDIKKITREMLLEAAILAKNGNDNPADHLQGNFLDIHREEINKKGWIVYNQYMEERAIEKKAGKGGKLIRGGRI